MRRTILRLLSSLRPERAESELDREIKYTEFPGSETDLTVQGMALIAAYGIVMLGVCMLGCVVPTRRALNIEPTIALRAE